THVVMKINAFFLVVTLLFLISCREKHPHDHSNREHTHETNTALHDDPGLPDGLDTHNEDEGNEEPVMQYTGYSNAFEIFAEAGPLVAGENTRILAHYTQTPGFNPLESGKVTLVIQVGAKAGAPIQGVPVRKGIY